MGIGTDTTYQSSSLIDTARGIATTTRRHLRDLEDAHLRKRMLTALVERNGGVEHNVPGNGFDWNVKDRIHDAAPNDGTQRREYAPQNQFRQANLLFGGMEVKDSIRKGELLANRGREAVIRVADTMQERLTESIMEKFAERFYDSGDDTSYKLYGFDSFTAVKTSSSIDQAFDWGTAGVTPSQTEENNAVGDPIMVPSDSYGGLSTVLGQYGGAQTSGGWPEGTCHPQFDFWAPLLINTNSTFFGAISSGSGWSNNAVEAIRFGLLHAGRNNVDNAIDLILMDRSMLYELQNLLLSGNERVMVTATNGVKSFGFNNVFEVDGVECSTEYGIPLTTGNRAGAADVSLKAAYGFSSKNIKIMNRFSNLFHLDEASGEYTKETQSYDYCVEMLCQFKFKSPRNFIKWAGWSATS